MNKDRFNLSCHNKSYFDGMNVFNMLVTSPSNCWAFGLLDQEHESILSLAHLVLSPQKWYR